MNSDDVFVEISGQKYCLDGETLRPAEKDFQREVLKRLDGIESRLEKVEQRLDGVEQAQIAMHETLDVRVSRTNMLILWGGIAFTVLAAIIAFVEIFAPKLWEYTSRKNEREKWE